MSSYLSRQALKLWRIAELILLFAVLPVIFYFEWLPIPKILALLIFTLFCFLVLWFDDSYPRSSFLIWEVSLSELKKIFAKVLIFGSLIMVAAWYISPDSFLSFPRTNFRTWLLVMTLYPFLSALPQELIYRSYFFHRYLPVFKKEWVLILASTLLFSFLHIIYDNLIAIGFTLAGGCLFSLSYSRTKSLLVVSLEHALYGCIVFTSGFGGYFYEPFSL